MHHRLPHLLLPGLLALAACAHTPSPAQDQAASLERVDQQLNASTDEMTACFRRALGPSAEQLNGRILVRFEIDGEGFIQQLTVVESQLDSAQADLCVADTIRRIFFEDWVGRPTVRLTKPFSFVAGKS